MFTILVSMDILTHYVYVENIGIELKMLDFKKAVVSNQKNSFFSEIIDDF